MNNNKVYCIDNKSIPNSVDVCLTVKRWYEVLDYTYLAYLVLDDKNRKYYYKKSRFLSPEDAKKQLIKERFE